MEDSECIAIWVSVTTFEGGGSGNVSSLVNTAIATAGMSPKLQG